MENWLKEQNETEVFKKEFQKFLKGTPGGWYETSFSDCPGIYFKGTVPITVSNRTRGMFKDPDKNCMVYPVFRSESGNMDDFMLYGAWLSECGFFVIFDEKDALFPDYCWQDGIDNGPAWEIRSEMWDEVVSLMGKMFSERLDEIPASDSCDMDSVANYYNAGYADINIPKLAGGIFNGYMDDEAFIPLIALDTAGWMAGNPESVEKCAKEQFEVIENRIANLKAVRRELLKRVKNCH